MKVAISMWGLHKLFLQGDRSNIDLLRYAASLGVKGVELWDAFFPGGAGLGEIEEVLQETSLEVACYAVNNNFVHPQAKERTNAVEAIKQAIEIGSRLGTNCLRIVGGAPDLEVTTQEAETWILEGLAAVLPYAQQTKTTLCLENQGCLGALSEEIAQVLTKINHPHLKSSFNMANFLLVGEQPRLALERLKNRIGHVRAMDLRLASPDEEAYSLTGCHGEHYVGSVLGLGLVPVRTLMRMLKEQEYQGWIAVEFGGLEDALFGTEASLKKLRQYLYELQLEEG